MKPTIDAISPEQLQAWKRLADEATPEWYVDEDRPLCIRSRLKNQMRKDAYVAKVEFLGPPFDDEEHRKNAAFIAAARTAVPALIEYVFELEERLNKLNSGHECDCSICYDHRRLVNP